MPSRNYMTAVRIGLLRNQYRFVVEMEDEETGEVKTFSVWAETAALATARTINFIDQEKIHKGTGAYYLIPRIDGEKITTYEIF